MNIHSVLQRGVATEKQNLTNQLKGKVFLVGAGPGDPGLLTLKGADLLKQADVVVLDRLVDSSILDLIPDNIERIEVGKNAGHHPVPQSQINQILVQQALAGKTVVRLKGGDNFLFGRGGEELEALIAKDISFEVVPGVTSALAAPAYAGIPVTHRDYCSSVHLITGHKREEKPLDLDYEALVRLKGTLVFMMSLANVGEIMSGLILAGMPADTPAAAVEHGTRPDQRNVLATIESLERQVIDQAIQSPALFVVGRVCSLSSQMDWFSALPLKGIRVLVTRPKTQAAAFVARLRALGAVATAIPSIRTQAIDFEMPQLSDYDTLIFTSVTGVEAFMTQLQKHGLDSRSLSGIFIAVIGSSTASALQNYGLKADFIPKAFNGSDLANQLLANRQFELGHVLIARAKQSDPQLTDRLRAASIQFEELPVYETIPVTHEPFTLSDYDYLTFTSASCVDSLVDSINQPANLNQIQAVCIGQQTASRAQTHGMKVHISDQATTESMIECLCSLVHDKQNCEEKPC